MQSYFKSAKLFMWGLFSRFYFWAFALFFDPLGIIQDWFPKYAEYMNVPTSLAWTILIALLFWCAFLTYHEARSSLSGGFFKPDMHPKQLMRYLCSDAKFGRQFKERDKWFRAAQTAIRDELKKGRRLRAEGRKPGQWGDGQFRFPADFIDREYWETGDLNWIRILNADYEGDIDAYDHLNGQTLVDIQFSQDEVEAIWPKRNLLSRLLLPPPFSPFETIKFGPPPWDAKTALTEDFVEEVKS